MRISRRCLITSRMVLLLILAVQLIAFTEIVPPPQQAHAHVPETDAEIQAHAAHIQGMMDAERHWRMALSSDETNQGAGADMLANASTSHGYQRTAKGLNISTEDGQTAAYNRSQINPATFRDGYRTVAETETFLQNTAAAYPGLTELVDYGDSWEKVQSGGKQGSDLWALRLTNKASPGPKPVFFLLAAIHAREIVTSELATRYITYLLSQYNTDADVTWMLNEYEIVVVPIANPDGRKLVEQGYFQRKNTHISGTACKIPPTINNQFGIDLNRNFSFAWGTINTPDTPPCDETFPGSAAASEPETQALQGFLRTFFPDQRGPNDSDAAPATASGVLISLHSYGNLILWPWGYETQAAPNGAALEQLGLNLASYNGYTPEQSFDLYPTSGTAEDWIYGERGVPAFTFEVGPMIGGECAYFFPPFGCLDGGIGGSFWPLNLPAFLYATRVARAPYTQPAGPNIADIHVVSDTQRMTVTATIDDRRGRQPITAAELYLDRSPWYGGTAIALQPVDGAFDSFYEQGYVVLPTNSVSAHTLLLVRSQNAVWGPIRAAWAKSTEQPFQGMQPMLWLPVVGK